MIFMGLSLAGAGACGGYRGDRPWPAAGWTVAALRVLHVGVPAQVEPPVDHQADRIEDREAVHGELGRAGADLVAHHHRGDEGAVGGHRGGPAQHRALLLGIEDHPDAAEGGAVADAAGREQDHEHDHEDREVAVRVGGVVGQHHHVAGDGGGHHHDHRDDLGDDGAAHLVGDPAAYRADQGAHEGTDPGPGEGAGAVGVGDAGHGAVGGYLHHVAEDDVDGEGQGGGEADEGAEDQDVEDGHRPGVLVREDRELLLDIGLDAARDQAQQHHGEHDGQRQNDPHAQQAQGEHADDAGDGAHGVEAEDLAEGRRRGTRLRGDGAQVVHAEPAGEGQRDQEQQPDEAGVLDPGVGARLDAPDQGAAGVLQLHGTAGDGAEDPHGHHQRDQDLHGGDAELAEAGVHPQGIALLLLRVEGGDVAHGGGEVASMSNISTFYPKKEM